MEAFYALLSGLCGRKSESGTVVAYSAGSYIGSLRKNQDNFRAGAGLPYIRGRRSVSRKGVVQIRDLELFCVCDGIGGGYRGELAAKYALKAIRRFLKAEDVSKLTLRDALVQAAEWAQTEVCEFYHTVQSTGGCTLVMAAVRGDTYAFLNIGDSPGFLIPANGGSRELSRRHNMAGEKLRMGYTPEPSDKNHLLRYLGMPGTTAEALAHITEGRLQEGDCLLLCSDGITNAYLLPTLEAAVRSGADAADIAAAAAQEEGADNCTAVCLTVRQIPAQPEADSGEEACAQPTPDVPEETPECAPEKSEPDCTE